MDLKVLILEDDEKVQNHLKSLLSELNIHRVKCSDTAQNFLFELSIEKFHLLIIDCLLPGQMGGLDIIQKIEKQEDCSLWLISGVISRQNIDKSIAPKIDLFLQKPLKTHSIKQGIHKIRDNLGGQFDEEGIFSSFYKSFFQTSEFQHFAESHNMYKGHELGLLICLCALSKWTGLLVLEEAEKKQSITLTFLKGNLKSIQSPDQRSYFGILAGLYGMVPSSVSAKLAKEGGEPIGEKLVRAGYISPHSIHFILEEQTKIRLSSLMDSRRFYRLHLKESHNTASTKEFTPLSKIRSFISEILWPQVDVQQLKSFFENKSSIILQLGDTQGVVNISNNWQKKCAAVLKSIDGQKTFLEVKKQLESRYEYKEDELLFCFYYLLTAKYIYFDENKEQRKVQQDMEKKIVQFKNILDKKNHFELINLPKDASFREIKERLMKLIKVFHPDNYSDSVKSVCNEIISHLNAVGDVLLDDKKRSLYLDKLEKKTGDEFFQIFSKYESAKTCLMENRFQEGLELLNGIKNESSLPSDVKLYYAWAWIKTGSGEKDLNKMNEILRFIEKSALDVKYTALYYFVRSLHAFEAGDVFIAEQHIERSLKIDSRFLPSRIEWAKYKKKSKKLKWKGSLFKAG